MIRIKSLINQCLREWKTSTAEQLQEPNGLGSQPWYVCTECWVLKNYWRTLFTVVNNSALTACIHINTDCSYRKTLACCCYLVSHLLWAHRGLQHCWLGPAWVSPAWRWHLHIIHLITVFCFLPTSAAGNTHMICSTWLRCPLPCSRDSLFPASGWVFLPRPGAGPDLRTRYHCKATAVKW